MWLPAPAPSCAALRGGPAWGPPSEVPSVTCPDPTPCSLSPRRSLRAAGTRGLPGVGGYRPARPRSAAERRTRALIPLSRSCREQRFEVEAYFSPLV